MPINIDEAKKLPTTKKSMGSVAIEELLEFLTEQACNAGEIAEYLGVKKEGVYTKLKRLEDDGLITRVYQDNLSFWFTSQ